MVICSYFIRDWILFCMFSDYSRTFNNIIHSRSFHRTHHTYLYMNKTSTPKGNLLEIFDIISLSIEVSTDIWKLSFE